MLDFTIHLLYAPVAAVAIFAAVYLLWLSLSRGLSRSAFYQQATRYGLGSVLAALPWAFAAGATVSFSAVVAAMGTGLLWMLAYPVADFAERRHSSPEIDNFMDFGAGLYLMMLLMALAVAASVSGFVVAAIAVAAIEIAVAAVPLFQMIYFAMYRSALSDRGVGVILDTDVNEVLEFARVYPWWMTLAAVMAVPVVMALFVAANLRGLAFTGGGSPLLYAGEAVCAAVALYLLFKKRRGALRRSAIVRIWADTRDYRRRLLQYRHNREERLGRLEVSPAAGTQLPRTVVMVIGESASRDYMSAFAPVDRDTTPWLSAMAADKRHTVVFPNAYSCHNQTVPTLEQALTEKNQFNRADFVDSPSIVDIALKLGYRVTWLSNQGHIGDADTSVTLVAETAHVARWTRQSVGTASYDASLVDMIREEVKPGGLNFIVLHLMGNHFNFVNRYPVDECAWPCPPNDYVTQYKNSLRYTDTVLSRVYDYCRENLGLDVMVYFSDHACIPDKYRSPNFDGYGQFRIPMAVVMSDDYIAGHPSTAAALRANSGRCFTNDLSYELMCGIFDVESNHFDAGASIARPGYRYDRPDLSIFNGTRPLSDDTNN